MANSNRPCHSQIDADECLLEHVWVRGFQDCAACGWCVCVMDGCPNYVETPNTRCSECHALACPCAECRDCECVECVAAGLVEDDSDGVPVEMDEEETSAQTVETPTLSDAQLLAILDEMVECRSAA